MNSRDNFFISFLLRRCYMFMCKYKSKLEKHTKKLLTRNLFPTNFRKVLFALFYGNLIKSIKSIDL